MKKGHAPSNIGERDDDSALPSADLAQRVGKSFLIGMQSISMRFRMECNPFIVFRI
jgi:hypothetical protein